MNWTLRIWKKLVCNSFIQPCFTISHYILNKILGKVSGFVTALSVSNSTLKRFKLSKLLSQPDIWRLKNYSRNCWTLKASFFCSISFHNIKRNSSYDPQPTWPFFSVIGAGWLIRSLPCNKDIDYIAARFILLTISTQSIYRSMKKDSPPLVA